MHQKQRLLDPVHIEMVAQLVWLAKLFPYARGQKSCDSGASCTTAKQDSPFTSETERAVWMLGGPLGYPACDPASRPVDAEVDT